MRSDSWLGWARWLAALAAAPVGCLRAWRETRPIETPAVPLRALPLSVQAWLWAQVTAVRASFDSLRWQHAAAARAGWSPLSLLESGRFERRLARAERCVLGAWARST